MNKRKKVPLFQRLVEFDDTTFPPLVEPAEVQVDLATVLKAGEFHQDSANVFDFNDEVFIGRPNIRPTLIAAAKLATAVVLSTKFIAESLIPVAVQVHSSDIMPSVISPNNDDEDRVRKLIQGRFIVGLMNTQDDNDVAEYRRQDGVKDSAFFRTVSLNPLLLDRIEEVAASADTKDDLRRYIALLGAALSHETAHAVHTMIRPDFFLEEDLSLKVDVIRGTASVTPALTIRGVTYDDFGELVDVMYFDGASVETFDETDHDGNKLAFLLSTIALRWRQQNAWVDWEVADSDFRPSSYEPEGLGLFGEGIKTAKPVVVEFSNGIRHHQNGSVSFPQPGQYNGDRKIQEKINFDTGSRSKRRLEAEFEAAESEKKDSTSAPATSSRDVPLAVPAGDRVFRVRSARRTDGTCH